MPKVVRDTAPMLEPAPRSMTSPKQYEQFFAKELAPVPELPGRWKTVCASRLIGASEPESFCC